MAETETEADAKADDGAAPPEGQDETAKAADAKAEEPKADAKAEEPKADAKAEEPKAGGSSSKGLSPAKQVVAKSKPTEQPQRDGEEQPKSAQEIFQENLALIAVVVLLVSGAVVWWSSDESGRKGRSDAAWAALAKLEREQTEGTAGFAELASEHRNTTADPFIQIAWASRLYASGERDKVEQAQDILERVLRENPDTPLVQERVKKQLDKIKAELADPNVPWPEPKAEGAEDEAADLPPGEPIPLEDDHAGHDHAPGEHPEEAPADAPAEDAPAEEAPAEDAEAPAEEAPAEDAEAPAEDAPAEDAEAPADSEGGE
jgi:hypothetical protein